MADIYKRVREMDEKAGNQENDMETMISKLVTAKPMYTNPKRFGSQMRPKHLKSLSLCTPEQNVNVKGRFAESALNAYPDGKTEDLTGSIKHKGHDVSSVIDRIEEKEIDEIFIQSRLQSGKPEGTSGPVPLMMNQPSSPLSKEKEVKDALQEIYEQEAKRAS